MESPKPGRLDKHAESTGSITSNCFQVATHDLVGPWVQTIHFHSKCVDGGSCGSCPVNLQQIANKPIHTIRKDGFSTGLDGVVVFFNAGRADGNAGVLQEELRVDIAQNLAVSLGLHDLDQKLSLIHI